MKATGESTLYISRLVTVIELDWDAKRANAAPRAFNALSLRLDGDASFIYADGAVNAVKDDILFMPAGCGYTLDAHAHEHIICAHFETCGAPVTAPEVFTPIDAAMFTRCFRAMYSVWTKKEPGYEYAALSILNRIFENITAQESQRGIAAHDVRRRLEPVIRYITANFADPELSVGELAAMCGVSTTYFRRIFRAATGASPKEYIGRLRLGTACELLRSGYCTVSETAKKCGLPNTKYFSTFIRRRTGMTPSDML